MVREWLSKTFRNKRTQDRVQNNLGIIHSPGTVRRYRLDVLHDLDVVYDGRQYDDLVDWNLANEYSEYVPIRRRKPRVQFRLAKRMADEIAGKLFGEKVAPVWNVEDDPEATYFLKLVARAAQFKMHMKSAMQKMAVSGSVFVRFYFVMGKPVMEVYNSKWCYPEFDDAGDLREITIRWIWTDTMDLDEAGRPKEKWGQLYLSQTRDVLYDTPRVESGSDPSFQEVGSIEHGLGFVQGAWFRTTTEMGKPDGQSLIDPALSFFEEMDYSASQSSQAISYNQEPIPLVSGMDIEDIDTLIRSSARAWNLGREGDAKFLESNLSAVQVAIEMRDKIKQSIQDVTRILLMDPEKLVGSAQSGKALEILHGPLLDLIYDLRESIEPAATQLLTRMSYVAYMLSQAGQSAIQSPPGWKPVTLEPLAAWPQVFPETIEDLQKRVMLGTAAANASVISRETVTRWLAQSFDIEDIEAELAKIAAQPVLNPFGSF